VLSAEWAWQAANFAAVKEEAAMLAHMHGMGKLRFHSANSAGLFRGVAVDEAMVRVGIAAYGCLEMEQTLGQPPLRPVLSLWADRIATRRLAAGERVGYSGTFTAETAMSVSTYDVGYADGLLRSASNNYTTPGGERLLGRVSMDNTTFSGDSEQLLVFDDANDYAAAAGTIGYEILVGMRAHLQRIVTD